MTVTTDNMGPYSTADMISQLESSVQRFAELVSLVKDESATGAHTPKWPVGDVVRHVTYLPGYYAGIVEQSARLTSTANEMAAINDQNLSSLAGLSMVECGQKLLDDLDDFVRAISSAEGSLQVPFQAGSTATIDQLIGIAIGEYEMHGLDVAAAVGAPWSVDERAAAMAVLSAIPAAGAAWIDTAAAGTHSGSYEVRLRGGRGCVSLRFTDGLLDAGIRPRGRTQIRPQTVVSATPSAFLEVFYGRRSQWSAIARGQMTAWGTRPWKALTLRRKFLPI